MVICAWVAIVIIIIIVINSCTLAASFKALAPAAVVC